MTKSLGETELQKLDIELELTPEELEARLSLAVFSLLDEYPEHIPGAVIRALEIDVDPTNTGDAHKKMQRVAQLIGKFVSGLEDKLPSDVVKKIKYPPQKPSGDNPAT